MPLIDLNGLGHFKDRENAMIAEDFSASKAYAAGDYCYYNGTLYKFKTAHAAGAWTISDVEAAKLAGDVSDLKESLNGIIEVSPNLYNKLTNTTGKFINSSGSIIDSANDSITDYIFLEAGTYWLDYSHGAVHGFQYYARYDTNKVFKQRPQLNSNTITFTADCYIRLMGTTSHLNENLMLVKGSEAPSEYVPYYEQINDDLIPQKYKTGNIDFSRITNVDISMRDTDFVSESTNNLINQMLVEENKIISSQGVISETAGYAISAKIYLKTSTVYSYRNIYRIVYFDINDTRVGSNMLAERGTDYLTGNFTTPASFKYAIVTMSTAQTYNKEWQITEGSTLPAFELQHLIVDGYRIYDKPDVEISPLDVIANWDKTVPDTAPVYKLSTDVPAIESSEQNVDAIYAKYDALMGLYPNYITKTELGTNGDTENPVTLYRYDFKTKSQYSTNSKTKMILISGVHPEYAGIYALYHALEMIASDDKLIDLKSDLHLIVIPVVNAYGVNNRTRKNHNGIDLARNFEVGFTAGVDPTSETYSGTTALSEVEDQYIDAIMANNTDAIYFASCHNFQTMHPTNGVTWDNACIWGAGPTNYTVNVSGKVIAKMTNLWNSEYGWDETTFGLAKRDALMGSEGDQGLKYGIQGLTFEVGAYFRKNSETAYTSFSTSRNTETYINMIRTAAHCFNYRDKVHQFDA